MPTLQTATVEGSHRYAKRMVDSGLATEHHFRHTEDDLTLSSIGMGSYLGEANAQDDELMHDAVVASVLEGGINVIDTAINYRLQRSERSIGKALQTLFNQYGVQRDELFIASKNGFLTPDADVNEDFRTYFQREFIDSNIVQRTEIAGMHCMSPSYLADQLDRSLNNLGLQSLDLMYLHNAAESQLPEVGYEVFFQRLEKAFAFYEEARKQGKIRYYGLATWNCFRLNPNEDGYLSLAEVVQVAERVGGKEHGFRFIQLPFNFAMTEALTINNQSVFEGKSSLLEAAQAFGIGVFSSVPLLQGQLLQDKLPKFEGCQTPSQNCLQFIRSVPGIIAPLVGHKQASHVKENTAINKVAPVDFDVLQDHLQQFV